VVSRYAQATARLQEVVRFYTDGVGLPLLGGFEGHEGYSGVFIGLPGAEYHLEFTEHVDGSPGPAPTPDNLLVLYVREAAERRAILRRLTALGYESVEPENPYWLTIGAVTVEDPDGWRVVLAPADCPRAPLSRAGTRGSDRSWFRSDR
jgi:hypothetical protein